MRNLEELKLIKRVDELKENELSDIKINNKYHLMKQVGKGSYGVVYKAKNLAKSISQDFEFVAIKLIILPKSKTENDKKFEEEIKDEIKKFSTQIFNERVVNIKDSFEWNNFLCIVTEYVDGRSFKDLIKESNFILTSEEIIYYFKEISLAVQGMHDMKMIHRDLKPDNILLTSSNKIKVTDFGISHIKGIISDGGITKRAKKPKSPGTPRFSSPEQYLDSNNFEDISSYQADIFSIGVMMYESAVGSPIIKPHDPSFYNKNNFEVNKALQTFYLEQTLINDVILPSELNPKITISLENIIMKCLEKNVNDRYQTAQELYNDLLKLENGEKIDKKYTRAPLKNDFLNFKKDAALFNENFKFSNFNNIFLKKILVPFVIAIFVILLIIFAIILMWD